MPLYEYRCAECGHQVEVLQKINDDPLSTCGECSGTLEKLISRTAFVLKGSGWYATDYAGKNGSKGSEAKEDTVKSDSSGDTTSKPAAASKETSSKKTDGGGVSKS